MLKAAELREARENLLKEAKAVLAVADPSEIREGIDLSVKLFIRKATYLNALGSTCHGTRSAALTEAFVDGGHRSDYVSSWILALAR